MDLDASFSLEAQERSMQHMIEAGAHPMTSLRYLLKHQQDWARQETKDLTASIGRRFGGAYHLGTVYARTMFGGVEGGRRPGTYHLRTATMRFAQLSGSCFLEALPESRSLSTRPDPR